MHERQAGRAPKKQGRNLKKQAGHLKMQGGPPSYAALANTLVLCIGCIYTLYVLHVVMMVGWESTSTCETQCIQVTLSVATAKHNNSDG